MVQFGTVVAWWLLTTQPQYGFCTQGAPIVPSGRFQSSEQTPPTSSGPTRLWAFGCGCGLPAAHAGVGVAVAVTVVVGVVGGGGGGVTVGDVVRDGLGEPSEGVANEVEVGGGEADVGDGAAVAVEPAVAVDVGSGVDEAATVGVAVTEPAGRGVAVDILIND